MFWHIIQTLHVNRKQRITSKYLSKAQEFLKPGSVLQASTAPFNDENKVMKCAKNVRTRLLAFLRSPLIRSCVGVPVLTFKTVS